MSFIFYLDIYIIEYNDSFSVQKSQFIVILAINLKNKKSTLGQ